MSYHLTYEYGIPHGHAVALTLGRLLVINREVDEASCIDERGVEHVRSAVAAICDQLGAAEAHQAAEALGHKMQAIGLATSLDEINLPDPVAIDRWVDSVEPDRLANNPRRLTSLALCNWIVPRWFQHRTVCSGAHCARPSV